MSSELVVVPFEAHAADVDLAELRARLTVGRLPEAETVDRAAQGRNRWQQGVPLADLRDLVDYWRDGSRTGRSETRDLRRSRHRQRPVIETTVAARPHD